MIRLLAAGLLLAAASRPAAAAPLQVMFTGTSSKASPTVQCVGSILSDRLARCAGVDVVGGGRASSVISAAHSPALVLPEEARWARLQAAVAIDAMITVENPPEPAEGEAAAPTKSVVIRLYRTGGVVTLEGNFSETAADVPRAISDLLVRLGRELKLGEADLKTLGETDIQDAKLFRVYYLTRSASASWPQNPYASVFFLLQGMANEKHDWAGDAATVRMVAGYTHSAMHGRGAEKLSVVLPMAKAPLLRLMGTPHEEETHSLLKLERADKAKTLVESIEAVLLQVAAPLGEGKAAPAPAPKADASAKAGKPGSIPTGGAGDLDELGEVKPADKSGIKDVMEAPTELSAGTGRTEFTPEQRLGALRMLGVMNSAKALPLLERTSRLVDVEARRATVEALRHFKGEEGLDLLARLDADAEPTVAFAAALALRDRQHAPATLRERATAMLAGAEPWRTRAAEALAADVGLEDPALLAKLAADPAPSVRSTFRKLRAAAAPRPLAEVMRDPDGAVILASIRKVPASTLTPGSPDFGLLVRLASDDYVPVAQAARDRLAPLRPKEPLARARQDLLVEASYLRQRAVAWLAASPAPEAREALKQACANPEPHTRLAAMRALAGVDIAAARPLLAAALVDPHRLVRLYAAALLGPAATPAEKPAMQAALASVKDRAARLYLEEALARIDGKPALPPQPPANTIPKDVTVPWQWGVASTSADSPFNVTFIPSHGNHVRDDHIRETQKQGHAIGKVFFFNIAGFSEPGLGRVDPSSQDAAWLYADDQLDTEHLPWIDGIDFQNSTLSPEALWTSGWRFFCDDLGIDPARVAGEKKNLTAAEAGAWSVWALRRCVEGRNQLYDFVQAKFGKLHPGFQVCESLGGIIGAAGAPVADWKFDVGFCGGPGGAPDLRRSTYNLIRQAKTLWPDRPVFWVGAGVEVKDLAIVKYDFKTPSEPISGRHYRAYTEALSVWAAGANPGWPIQWCLRTFDWADPSYAGYSIIPEDTIGPAPKLRAAIDMAFENVEPVIRQKDALAKVNNKGPALSKGAKDDQMDGLIESMVTEAPDQLAQRIAKDKEQMLLGFKIYGKHLLDLGRLFASLPRQNLKPDALVVLPQASRRTNASEPDSGSPVTDCLNSYDVVEEINEISRLDLARYRFIAVKDPAALTDATIAAITQWLKESPGVLYVHVDLTADNARQAGTPERFDGKLQNDWPWEADVNTGAEFKPAAVDADSADDAAALKRFVTADGKEIAAPDATLVRTIKPAGGAAKVLATRGGSPALVAWQKPGFKGAVVFDGIERGGAAYRAVVRAAVTDLKERGGVGVALTSPARHDVVSTDAFEARVTQGDGEAMSLKGVDLLTGEASPTVGPDRGAAVIARDLQGRYAAGGNGVSVLCDRPIKKVEKVEGGLRIECDGLIQAASASGKIEVAPEGGAALPEVGEAKTVRWMLAESSEGVATRPAGEGGQAGRVTLVRCARAVMLKAK